MQFYHWGRGDLNFFKIFTEFFYLLVFIGRFIIFKGIKVLGSMNVFYQFQ